MMLRLCGVRSGRRWQLLLPLTLLAVFGGTASARGQSSSGLISQSQAHAIGLERAWFARAQVNPAHSNVVRWILSQDQIVLLTSAGLIHVMDANTGQTVWTSDIGNPNYPSLGPAANDEFIGVVNGSTLYLLDRHSGRIVREQRLDGAPGAKPALGKDFVFIPLLMGRVEGYPLNDPKGQPWFYQSYGHAMSPPLATSDSVVWGTDAGYLYVGRVHAGGVRFRLETGGEFDAQPAYRAPLIYAVSHVGELMAVDEHTGALRWRYVTGFPTDRSPAVVGDRIYVASEQPELHCLDATTGAAQWEVAGISQFAAATKSRVFGIDQFGAVTAVDAATGVLSGRIQSGTTMTALVNSETDRLYLLAESGLVQCLHEIGAKQPIHYTPAPTEAPEKPKTGAEYHGNAQPAAQPEAAPAAMPTPPQPGAESPFGSPPPAADNANPFGAAAPATPPQAPNNSPPAGNKPAPSANEDPFGS